MKQSRRAFTLVELVVAVFILGIIGLVTLSMVSDSARVYTLLLARGRADAEVADAIERVRREARPLRTNVTASSTNWSFISERTTAVQIAYSAGSVDLNGNRLAEGVALFELKYFTSANQLLDSPVGGADLDRISRVEINIKVTNSHAASEAIVNLHLQGGYLK